MNYTHRCQGMISIECAQPLHLVMDKYQAEQLATCIGMDLAAVIKNTTGSALAVAAATYPGEQLMQPGFPVHSHLLQYATAAFQGEQNQAQLLAIGGDENQRMPEGLRPEPATNSLVHIPYVLLTDDPICAESFEAQLMHKGMISPGTFEQLNLVLNIPITHANHMTNLDLVAMIHNHYEQIGLSEVWNIIETALIGQEPKTATKTAQHNHFFLVDHLVFTPWFSWSDFQTHHADAHTQSYVNWILMQRQSTLALSTHGLEVKPFKAELWPPNPNNICLGQFEKHLIKGDHWTATEALSQPATQNSFTYWTDPQAGIVACQTVRQGEAQTQIHHPIHPQGIKTIESWYRNNDDQINQIPFATDNHMSNQQ